MTQTSLDGVACAASPRVSDLNASSPSCMGLDSPFFETEGKTKTHGQKHGKPNVHMHDKESGDTTGSPPILLLYDEEDEPGEKLGDSSRPGSNRGDGSFLVLGEMPSSAMDDDVMDQKTVRIIQASAIDDGGEAVDAD